MEASKNPERGKPTALHSGAPLDAAYRSPLDYLDNRFVYVVLSSRARGLSVGVNLSPDRRCNFDCVYCEVNRDQPPKFSELDVDLMSAELQRTLKFVHSRRLRERPMYASLPSDMLELRHVALSGEGEPTLNPRFADAVEATMHVRALGGFPFFKIVLITNGTWLDQPQVQSGLRLFTKSDEIWVKLDAGTTAYMEKVNRPQATLDRVLENILQLGRQRPVVIQSLFSLVNGEEPPPTEIEEYARRLEELKLAGAQISMVQVYSANRPTRRSECKHLPLKSLSRIAQHVRKATGLNVEVF